LDDTGPSPLLDVANAQTRLLAFFKSLEAETLELTRSAGRVLAADVTARLELPPFDNSSMDGFAVRIADTASASRNHPVLLSVIADIPAGQVSDATILAGQAARIMTGAAVPKGGEAVIPVEDTDFVERQPGTPPPAAVKIYRPASAGENVRPSGQDVRAGEVVMPAGIRLRPQDIGFLSMLGEAEVRVHRLPQVAVFSTGDELVLSAVVGSRKIDSNTYTIALIRKVWAAI
jgi:molybdopterin molybdotransferase